MSGTMRIAAWFGILFLGATCSVASESGDYTAEGFVLGPDGEPVGGARVLFYLSYGAVEPYSQLTTGSDGKYTFSIETGAAEGGYGLIVVQKEGLAWNCRRWLLLDDQMADIRLARPKELAGVVVDEKGEPIAGAAVSLQALCSSDMRSNYFSERLAQGLFTTATDERGRFHFNMLADGWQTEFRIAAPGYATLRTRDLPDAIYTTYAPGQAGIRFVLRPEAQVRGTVVSDVDGQPIANVEVGLGRTQNSATSSSEPVVSDEAGRFQLRQIPAGDFRLGVVTLHASDPNWVGRSVPIQTKAGQTIEGVELKLTHGGMLEVKVFDEPGEPVEDAWLVVCDREGHCSGRGSTDVEGVCQVRLPAGEHKLVDVGKRGYHSHEPYFFFDIERGRTVRREVTIKKADRIEGVVVDVDGKPVSDVRVTLMPSPIGSVITDKRGRFTMIYDKWSRAYKSYDQTPFELIARDMVAERAATLELTESTKTFKLVLKPAVTVIGRVVDAEGRPVERVLVSSWLQGRGQWAWGMNLHPNPSVFSDRAGRFAIRCVPAERTCEIRCRAPGYEQTKQEFQVSAATGRPFGVGTIKLEATNETQR